MTEQYDPVLLFDGVCDLCSGSIQFILKRDKTRLLKFAALQSEFGADALQRFGLPKDRIESLILIENGKVYTSSSAALRVSKHLKGFWPIFKVCLAIPKVIRDTFYDWIARNRYKWFGKKVVCWVPEPKWADRFIDRSPA